MSLTFDEVKHIAELARLQLTDDEMGRYQHQLSDILDYAGRLQQLDTSQILPTSSMLVEQLSLRKDSISDSLTVQELLANSPQTEENQFKVPPVME